MAGLAQRDRALLEGELHELSTLRDFEALEALLEEQARGMTERPAWLLDAYTPGKAGGTGARFDWALAAEAGQMGRPVFLAGGLNAENIAAAIEQARPYGVDVSSGVELTPGKKDPQKLRAFIQNAKGVEL